MKKVLSVLLASVMTWSGAGFVMAAENTVTLYVSPNGNDDAKGTISSPLKTLEGARAAVKKINDGTKKIDVVFREGEYRIGNSINFTAQDSGTDEYPITYKAYEDEKVEIKGSIVLDASKAKQVTDEKVLSRMYKNVRNKVVEIDLEAQGVKKEMLRDYTKTFGTEKNITGGEVNGIYCDGVPQTLAEWPNGFGSYATWDSAPEKYTFHYTDTEPLRWTEAKYLYIGGYNAYDFAYMRKSVASVDTEANTITCTSIGDGFTSSQSRRWKVFNLLEEIDMPGEYYIDPDEMKLYWYPEKNIDGVRLEFSWLASDMLRLEKTQNISFENLQFIQTQGHGVVMKDVNNVDFSGCTFKDIGKYGVYVYSDQKAETDKDYWQRNDINASYNCDILNCRFENIGARAVDMNGGNVDTLKKSNNRIENNIFTRCAQLAKNSQTVMISGVGITVKNNEFSDLPFHAINIWGNDHTITYNEIYDVIQESDDCGAIYAGRNTLHRGTEIAYNYIHDIKPVKELVYNFQGGIYLDDRIGGFDIHHNIIKGAQVDLIINGGVDFNFSNNTMIDIDKYNMRIINGGIHAGTNSEKSVWEGYIADEELYYSHYKNLRQLIEWGKANIRDERMAQFTTVEGNLSVDAGEESIGTNTVKYGKVKNNTGISECADFVDAENQDYRIKKGSRTNIQNPDVLTDDFDISKFGLQEKKGFDENDAGFVQISPKNGAEAVNSTKVDFKWQDARGANRYKLVIATDPELKNIVHEEISYYNVTSVEGLKNNTVYYWKVWAENISREDSMEWQTQGPVFSFCTSIYETIDTTHLSEVSKKTEEKLQTLEVGSEPGQYAESTIANVKNLIELSKIIADARLGMVSQRTINNMANTISGSVSALGITNKGYIDLSKYFTDKNNWSHEIEINDSGEVTLNKGITKSNNFGLNGLNHMSGSVLYSFDAKFDVPKTYIILGENKDNKTAPYSAVNVGYSFLFKKDVIELHVTSGTTQTIVETCENHWANDGKFHNIQYGFINTKLGNFALLYIDGEPVVEYFDVINQEVNTAGTFMVHVGNDECTLTMKKAENIGTADELNKIIEDGYYKSAKTIIDKYSSDVGVIAIDAKGKKAFTPDGVYNIEGTQNVNSGLMMTAEAIDKVFGTTTTKNGQSALVKSGNSEVTVRIEENGLISVEALMKALGRESTYSAEQGLLIVGNIIYMNNLKVMAKTRQLMDIMETLPERGDYIFQTAK